MIYPGRVLGPLWSLPWTQMGSMEPWKPSHGSFVGLIADTHGTLELWNPGFLETLEPWKLCNPGTLEIFHALCLLIRFPSHRTHTNFFKFVIMQFGELWGSGCHPASLKKSILTRVGQNNLKQGIGTLVFP